MAIRTYNFTFDVKRSIMPEPVFIRQNDSTGATLINVHLVDNGAPVTINGDLEFRAMTADSQNVIADTTGFSNIDIDKGAFSYALPNQLSMTPGKIRIAYFMMVDASGNASTLSFAIFVKPSADLTPSGAKNYISVIDGLIKAFNEWNETAQSSWQDFVNANKQIIESIDPGGTLLAEIVAARGKYETLGIREDAQDNTIKENSSLIDTKVGKTYVDAVLASIAQGGPRELFYSIQALKDKYPTGEDGTYLVLDTYFTDGAHAFIWSASNKKWEDIGPYGTNEKTLTKLIDKASAFVEQTQKSTQMEITDMTSAANDARWTFSYQYSDGYVVGAWLNIIGNVDQDYSVSFVGVSTNRVLYTFTGKGHGKIVVPVNRYINDKFIVSIKCQSFAFTVAEKNGVRFSNQEFDDLKVGTQLNLQWSNDDKSYNLGIEMLYHSVKEDLMLALKKLETTPSANVSSTTDFDRLTQPGGYWIERPQSSDKPEVKNGPNNATWGNYAVYNMQFGDSPQSGSFKMIMQITNTYASETGVGTFLRYVIFNRDGSLNADTPGIREWIRLDNVPVEKPKLKLDRMFVAGDSITAGHPYENVTGIHWWESVAKTLSYKVTVGAKNGAGYIYRNGPTNAISIVDSTDFTQYDVAVFAFGTNDYGNNMPLGELGDLYPAKETLYGAVNYVIKTVYSKNPTINLILSTPLNRCDKGDLASKYAYGTPNTQGYTLSQVVEAIKTQADYYGISYVDNSNSPFNSLSIPSLLVDKLHPTQQGYKLLGAHLASAIGATVRPFIEGGPEDGN